MGEVGEGQSLKPDAAGTGQGGERNSVATKEHVVNSLDSGDVKAHARFEQSEMAGMDAHSLVRREIVVSISAPSSMKAWHCSGQLLPEKAVAAKIPASNDC